MIPWDIVSALLTDAAWSTLRWLIGLSIGVSAAVALHLLGILLRPARRPLGWLVDFLRAVPVIALVSAFFALYGTDEIGKFLMIGWATAFPIYIHIVGASVPSNEERQVFAAARLRRWDVMKWLHLPLLAASVLGGLRIALGIGWICVVAAEMLGVYDNGPWSGGLGERVTRLSEIPNYPLMGVYLAAFGLLGLGSAAVFDWAARKSVAAFRLDLS
jgi:sulfonate transport system permease protein